MITMDAFTIAFFVFLGLFIAEGFLRTLARLFGMYAVVRERTCRVYVLFGTHWYPYLMRRLAERPANIAFITANILKEWTTRR